MNEHDVIRFMGRFPDEIIREGDAMVSRRWECSVCHKIFMFDEPSDCPAPCCHCGSIFFEKKEDVK